MKMKIEWGNAPQWVSAICAFALTVLAIYGLFFSTTSQALVSYLQSELAVRNQRIAGLELREQQLQLSVKNAESNLGGLSEEKSELEKQVATLRVEQESYSKRVQELGSTLSGTQFSLAREKVGVKLASGLSELAVIRIHLGSDWLTPDGVRARMVRPWQSYLNSVEKAVADLPEADRAIARTVLEKFVQQCGRYSSVVVQIPALRVPPGADFSSYDNDRDKHPVAIRAKGISKQIEQAENDIEACFKAVKQ
jgi:hypothetical protein